jgi:hypothetical protein
MANQRRYLEMFGKSAASSLMCSLALCLCILAGTLLSGCAPEVIPSDNEVIKLYLDNHSEFERVTKLVLAEGNQDYRVLRHGGATYGASSNPAVSQAAINGCHQIMARTFCVAVMRKAGTVYYLFHEHDGRDFFRSKALLYNTDYFKDLVWTPKGDKASSLRYAPVGLPGTSGIEPNDHWKIEYRYEKR